MSNDKYILSIDPGLSTGGALLRYTDETAPVLEEAWQFGRGAEGLQDWLEGHLVHDDPEDPIFVSIREWPNWVPHTSIVEKFNARNTGNFSYTTASLEPLRCEGVLVAHGLPDQYVQPPQQYLVGGKDKAEKRRRQHKFLKESGFYRTGKDLAAPDADDFRSACAHALSYLMRSGHKPTYDLVSEWIERNPV